MQTPKRRLCFNFSSTYELYIIIILDSSTYVLYIIVILDSSIKCILLYHSQHYFWYDTEFYGVRNKTCFDVYLRISYSCIPLFAVYNPHNFQYCFISMIVYRYRHFEMDNRLYYRAIAGKYNNIIVFYIQYDYNLLGIMLCMNIFRQHNLLYCL